MATKHRPTYIGERPFEIKELKYCSFIRTPKTTEEERVKLGRDAGIICVGFTSGHTEHIFSDYSAYIKFKYGWINSVARGDVEIV